MLTKPITFENIDVMNSWLSRFEVNARAISAKYNDSSVWDRTIIHKDSRSLQVTIEMGTYTPGSASEKAANEILRSFNTL